MIKKTIRLMPIVAMATTGFLFGCVDSDKDLYDSSYEMPNPMGDDFAAPDGFSWKTMTSKNVSIEVKDEEGGLYAYLVEIFTEDPLNSENPSPIAARSANQENNFKVTATIDLLPTQEGIYIRQTDPRNRIKVYPFEVPADNNDITCKLFYTESAPQSRAVTSRAATTRSDSSFEKPDYTSIPADATEIKDMGNDNLKANSSYKITSDYKGTFTFWDNDGEITTRVYVAAEWEIPSDFTFQNGIEIIVMDGGEISSDANMKFVNNSILTIMEGGKVEANNITFSNGSPAGLRNWGTLEIKEELTLSSGASLYNKGIITSKNVSINSNSNIVNDNRIEIEGDLDLPSGFNLENNGELSGKKITTNSGSVITNTATMVFEEMSFTNVTINNSCSMEATNSFYENGATFNFSQGYLKALNMTFVNGTVNLSNGSMLETTQTNTIGGTKFYGTGENASMIKSTKTIYEGGAFTYDGNLAIECDEHVKKEQWWDNFVVRNGAYITNIGQSDVTIEVCTGEKNEGNPGEAPKDPEFPIIEDYNNYAYLFEDQWPVYGDYDMNDAVMIVRKRHVSTNKQNKVKEFKFEIDLAAVGATNRISAAIMFDDISVNEFNGSVELDDAPVSFDLNNKNIENGQDNVIIPLVDNMHSALESNRYVPINTISNYEGNKKDVKNINFSIKFDNPTLSPEAFNISKMNIFIIVGENNSNKRKEIHIAGFQPTKKADTSMFGNNNDKSSLSARKYYISKDNLAWGIMVPANFKWPLEYANIKNVYPQFTQWVTSGGEDNKNWWNDFDVNRVYQTNKN